MTPSRGHAAFGAELRRARVAKGLGLREAARLAGVSACFLSQIERGCGTGLPCEDTTRKLAELLGLDPDRLLALAGRLAEDVHAVLVARVLSKPSLATDIREGVVTLVEQIRRLVARAEKDSSACDAVLAALPFNSSRASANFRSARAAAKRDRLARLLGDLEGKP